MRGCTREQACILLANLLGLAVSLRRYYHDGKNKTDMYILTIERPPKLASKVNLKPFSLCEREECFMKGFDFYDKYFVSNKKLLSNSASLKESFQDYVRLSLILILIGAKTMTSEIEVAEEKVKIGGQFGLSDVQNCDKSSHTEGPDWQNPDELSDCSCEDE